MKKTVSALLALLTCSLPHVEAQADELNYENFSTTSGLVLQGNAYPNEGVLRLTDAQAWSMGSAFSADPQNISSFSAQFSFRYTGSGREYGSADGVVFVIKNSLSDTGIDGGSMGYRGIANSIGVEFDNWYNPEYGDPPYHDNHIGINIGGSVNSVAIYNLNPATFNNTGTWYGWVDYNGTTLSASVNQTGIKPAEAMLSQVVNIPDVIGSYFGHVGFTAATGAAYQNHDILSLQYSPDDVGDFGDIDAVPEPSTIFLLGTGSAVIAALRRKQRHSRMAA